MRSGDNPNKSTEAKVATVWHHVIMPVYIPHAEGYFRDSFKILRLSLESLIRTVAPGTYITVVDNGSAAEVSGYLDQLFHEGHINEIIHTINIGKINAVMKGLAGINSVFFTVCDQDILFLEHWQQASFAVFDDFPKAGVVGIIPMFNTFKTYSDHLLFDFLLSDRLKFRPVKNPEALQRFYDSIWTDRNYNQHRLKEILTLSSPNGEIAVVGSGHVVATYRRDIFDTFQKSYTRDLLSPESDKLFLDLPPLHSGYYRFTTYDNYAYHMGNAYESWMSGVSGQAIARTVSAPRNHPKLKQGLFVRFFGTFKKYFVQKIIFKPIFYRHFLKYKGLQSDQISTF
ncbi:glycosyltransferase family 2 protein [Flavobacterium magnum]|uniref:Glycosyltransferase family 2 protein n=1 Tax=Flavobacterium magnum TaxID=2162713 RepID=A0A2S0RDS6_9FLAO|nr:glycosyltransferase [Flavobacterium magnum]AWA29775.1 glycosyltransferase family 2 protein [Flavobacterium magnum]